MSAKPETASFEPAHSLRRSTRLQATALLTALYLAIALFFALWSAVARADPWIFAFVLAAGAFAYIVTQIRWSGGVTLILGLSFCAQLLWAAWIDPLPFGELASLWSQARRFAAGYEARALYDATAPSAAALYGGAIAVFGDNIWSVRALSAFMWTAQTYFVWKIADEIPEARPFAFGAAAIHGFAPSLIVYASFPSGDAVFGFFALIALSLILSHRRRGLILSAALCGAALAAAFYARPAALGYLFGVGVLLAAAAIRAMAPKPRMRLAIAAVALMAGFLLAAAPQVWVGHRVDGRVSIGAGAALGHQLLLGTNRRTGGGYNLKDLEEAGYVGANALPRHEAERKARAIAWERVTSDPIGFAWFAATEKMRKLWETESFFLSWSLNAPSPGRDAFEATPYSTFAPALIDGFYIMALAAAALGAARMTRSGGAARDSGRWLLIYATLLGLGAAHAFLEAQPRNHLAFTPLIAILAAYGAHRAPRVRDLANKARRKFSKREEAF